MRAWFTFNSSDRAGIAALIIILLLVIIVPRFFRNDKITVEDMDRLKKEMDIFLAEMEKQQDRKKSDTIFAFDPNTTDSASLVLLGFSPRQAKSIINYRNKGGRFYNRESFGKSFVVSDEMYARLYYYIDIKNTKQKSDRERKNEEKTKITENKEIAKPEKSEESEESNSNAKKTIYTVELNSADFAELQKFRGIGEYYAGKIVEYRKRLGGFHHAGQLMEIRGIDSTRFEMFRNQIRIDTSQIKRIKINTVTEYELAKHPYISNFTAKAIISYRKFKGVITSPDEMLKEKIITEKQIEKIAAYIEY
jgi:competence ComEA-like helix-hairpin-helix protein